MRQIRRLDLIWQGNEVEKYEMLKEEATTQRKEIPEFIKEIIEREIDNKINCNKELQTIAA
jgi:hypothetical protein